MIIFLALGQSYVYADKPQPSNNTEVTIRAQDENLDNIINIIYNQTGCKVYIHKKWSNLTISGHYLSTPLNKLIPRLFKRYSHSVIIDEKNKAYYVSLFGEPKAASTEKFIANSIDVGQRQNANDINKLHAKQLQELEKYLSNPNSVDPVSGMSLSSIQRLHAEQIAEVSDPKDAIEEERKSMKEFLSSEDAIEPFSNMTVTEIETQHANQMNELNALLMDPTTFIDENEDMTLGELQQLHRSQMSEIN